MRAAPEPPADAAVEVIEVKLQGPNIRAAWLAHPVTRAMAATGPDWRPSSLAGTTMAVYHACRCGDTLKADGILHNGLSLEFASDRSQLWPNRSIHFSLSGLRPFLWVVFANLIAHLDVTMQGEISALHGAWLAHGRRYKGVLLLEYSIQAPSPALPHLDSLCG